MGSDKVAVYSTLKECSCCGKPVRVRKHVVDKTVHDRKESFLCFSCLCEFEERTANDTQAAVPHID
jgi:hypothetical protein